MTNKLSYRLNKEFEGNYSEIGGMPLLSFKPAVESAYKLLIAGTERGSMRYCSDAAVAFARELKNKKCNRTLVDILPVIDIAGYPAKDTIASFESPSALNGGSKPMPKNVLDLLSIAGNYDMVVQASSVFKEEWAFCNGYFIVPLVNTAYSESGKKVVSMSPAAKDFVGTLVQKIKDRKIPLQTLHNDGMVGESYVMLREGVLVPARLQNDEIFPATRNILSIACQRSNTECLLLTAPASKYAKNKDAKDMHRFVLEEVVNIYERIYERRNR